MEVGDELVIPLNSNNASALQGSNATRCGAATRFVTVADRFGVTVWNSSEDWNPIHRKSVTSLAAPSMWPSL